MKKLLLLLACASMVFASCDEFMKIEDGTQNESGVGGGASTGSGGGGSSSGSNGGAGGIGGGSGVEIPDSPLPPAANPLEPTEQKEKIENILKELLEQFPAEDYEHLIEIAWKYYDFGSERFDNDYYDTSAADDAWENNLEEKIYSELFEDGLEQYIVRASNFNGILTFYEKKAEYEESDEAKIILKDFGGEDWVLELKPVGWKKDVYIGELDGESLTVDIPSQVMVEVSIGSKTYIELDIRLDYRISSEGLDIENDRVSVSTTFRLDDISLTVSNAGYNAKTGDAGVGVNFKRGNKTLMATEFKANGKVKLDEEYEGVMYQINDASFTFDLMGQMQIVGLVDDIQEIIDFGMEEDGSDRDTVMEAVDMLNERISVCISYDGGRTSHAQVVLEYLEDEDEEGDYYIVPVLLFGDGTSYSMYEFFDLYIADELEGWENDINEFVQDYMDLVEKYFGEDVL